MDLLSTITNQLGDSFIEKVSGNIGADKEKTSSAINTALPFLLGALSKNASSENGAQSILSAVTKKHDGSILDNLSGLIDDPKHGDGAGILKHVLGNKEGMVEKLIAEKTGLGTDGSTGILQILAPIVMGAIGKEAKNFDIGSLAGLLGGTADKIGEPSVSSSLVSKFLDKDGDGNVKDDLLSMGMGFLKNQFKG